MRIISGRARGCKLVGPKGSDTRPTADRIKESLFNMIGLDLVDTSFLDLYSGSGAIGLEALSRGAKDAIFVESSRLACRAIETNINKTRFNAESELLHMNVDKALKKLSNRDKKFDFIFMDPPYNIDVINDTLNHILVNNLLAPDGIIIIERPRNYKIKEYEKLEIFKERDYKITTISFLKGV